MIMKCKCYENEFAADEVLYSVGLARFELATP
jgi:hypothetical protein